MPLGVVHAWPRVPGQSAKETCVQKPNAANYLYMYFLGVGREAFEGKALYLHKISVLKEQKRDSTLWNEEPTRVPTLGLKTSIHKPSQGMTEKLSNLLSEGYNFGQLAYIF
jgi:hypothetical protein